MTHQRPLLYVFDFATLYMQQPLISIYNSGGLSIDAGSVGGTLVQTLALRGGWSIDVSYGQTGEGRGMFAKLKQRLPKNTTVGKCFPKKTTIGKHLPKNTRIGKLLVKHYSELEKYNNYLHIKLDFSTPYSFAHFLLELQSIESGAKLCLAFGCTMIPLMNPF